MKRLHVTIHGNVQGVNFRASTLREAQRLNVRGWVKNNRDGSVEVVAEGEQAQLEKLREFLQHGPPAAKVISVDQQWDDARQSFSRFAIRY